MSATVIRWSVETDDSQILDLEPAALQELERLVGGIVLHTRTRLNASAYVLSQSKVFMAGCGGYHVWIKQRAWPQLQSLVSISSNLPDYQ